MKEIKAFLQTVKSIIYKLPVGATFTWKEDSDSDYSDADARFFTVTSLSILNYNYYTDDEALHVQMESRWEYKHDNAKKIKKKGIEPMDQETAPWIIVQATEKPDGSVEVYDLDIDHTGGQKATLIPYKPVDKKKKR